MDYNDTEKQISRFLNEQGNYVMNANDFSQSLKHQALTQSPSRGRGRGLPSMRTAGDSTGRTRLAAEIRRLGVHSHPIGYLATTDETLEQSPEKEITATLRALRINCSETMLEDRSTTTTDSPWQNTEDIRIDGKVPVILNGALFQKPRSPGKVRKTMETVPEPLDPDTPLGLQFSTIAEFHANNPFYEDVSKQPEVPVTKAKQKKQVAKQPEKQPNKQQKSKKTKWKKVTVKELDPNTVPRGRYDVPYDTISTGSIALARQPQRELYDAEGRRVFPTSSGLL
ncbi:uncharacterized protein LOC118457604 [Anopheles albimanus]|uniref:Uncharacterized protein n=1 Tax=Anopheles albimanus TaxID=7167 RepID=A0A182F600_ANOAL|nr:uncharacterized protein LOC118457604 [Anopheles albimanus]